MITYKRILKNQQTRLKLLNALWFVPDKIMISLEYRLTMGKRLNLSAPKTFNEKLNWLKLHDRNPVHTVMVDKYTVREYVESIIGEEYLIPLIGKWNRYEDIDFNSLPDSFVLKCSHDSGSVKIITNKNSINHAELKEYFNTRLKINPYSSGREWPYKNVQPCIVVEKNMCDSNGMPPVDYKFFCFNGAVDSCMVCIGRGTKDRHFYFFDKKWKLKKYNESSQVLSDDFTIDKPKGIEKLFDLASNLSKGEAFVRIDFYLINGKPYFGEFTFFPASGYDNQIVDWADSYLGDLIDLSIVNEKCKTQ